MVFPVELAQGQVLEAMGGGEEARSAYRRAAEELAAKLAERPDDALVHASLGLAHAGLDARAAVRHGERAVELRPPSLDIGEGPAYLGILAEIYARTGDLRRAYETIRETLSIPGPDSIHWFQLHSGFVSVRDEPCFQELARES